MWERALEERGLWERAVPAKGAQAPAGCQRGVRWLTYVGRFAGSGGVAWADLL